MSNCRQQLGRKRLEGDVFLPIEDPLVNWFAARGRWLHHGARCRFHPQQSGGHGRGYAHAGCLLYFLLQACVLNLNPKVKENL